MRRVHLAKLCNRQMSTKRVPKSIEEYKRVQKSTKEYQKYQKSTKEYSYKVFNNRTHKILYRIHADVFRNDMLIDIFKLSQTIRYPIA